MVGSPCSLSAKPSDAFSTGRPLARCPSCGGSFSSGPRPEPDVILSGSRISRDGKWVAFHSIHNLTRTTQVWIAPVDRKRPVPQAEWIPITDGKAFAQDPAWGADANVLYFVSELDGFRCYWAQPLAAYAEAAIGRAMEALSICRDKMRNRAVTRARLIATEACRSAANGAEFRARVQREVGLDLEIVDRQTNALDPETGQRVHHLDQRLGRALGELEDNPIGGNVEPAAHALHKVGKVEMLQAERRNVERNTGVDPLLTPIEPLAEDPA